MSLWRKINRLIDRFVPTRYVLALWTFVGSSNIYAMRVNINVAIVAMAKDRYNKTVHGNVNSSSAGSYCPDTAISSNSSKHLEGEFDWDEQTQAMILSSFFWGYITTQLLGGRLAEILSGKWTFGFGVLSTAVLTLLTPLAARSGVGPLVAVRVLEGIFEGVTYPAMYSLFAKWSPPMERSQMFAFIFLGLCVGTIIASPISGVLLDIPFQNGNGWPLVFYFFGACGVVWFIFWCFFVFESPEVHPRISLEERDYIISSIQAESKKEESEKKKNLPVPWLEIFKSRPFWGIAIAHFGFYWGFNTLLTELPTYLKSVLRFNIKSSAFLSALPYLSKTFFNMLIGYGADFARRRKIVSTANARRICNSIGNFIPAAAFIALPSVGCDKTIALVLLIIAASGHAGATSGFFTSHVDISPNFAGTLMGLTNTIGTAASIAGPYSVGTITNHNNTIEKWGIVFYISAGVHIVSNIIYIILIRGEVQPWNYPVEPTTPSATSNNNFNFVLKSPSSDNGEKNEKNEKSNGFDSTRI